jgi:hypothetical protein
MHPQSYIIIFGTISNQLALKNMGKSILYPKHNTLHPINLTELLNKERK